jgi:hypothetical protein
VTGGCLSDWGERREVAVVVVQVTRRLPAEERFDALLRDPTTYFERAWRQARARARIEVSAKVRLPAVKR